MTTSCLTVARGESLLTSQVQTSASAPSTPPSPATHETTPTATLKCLVRPPSPCESAPIVLVQCPPGDDGEPDARIVADVEMLLRPEMQQWRNLAVAAPRHLWRPDADADSCDHGAGETGCKVRFGPSVGGLSIPSFGLEVIEDTADAGEEGCGMQGSCSLRSVSTLASTCSSNAATASTNRTSMSSDTTPSLAQVGSPAASCQRIGLEGVAASGARSEPCSPRPKWRHFVLHRRHHCRRCGGVFCARHSTKEATLVVEQPAELAELGALRGTASRPDSPTQRAAAWKALTPTWSSFSHLIASLPPLSRPVVVSSRRMIGDKTASGASSPQPRRPPLCTRSISFDASAASARPGRESVAQRRDDGGGDAPCQRPIACGTQPASMPCASDLVVPMKAEPAGAGPSTAGQSLDSRALASQPSDPSVGDSTRSLPTLSTTQLQLDPPPHGRAAATAGVRRGGCSTNDTSSDDAADAASAQRVVITAIRARVCDRCAGLLQKARRDGLKPRHSTDCASPSTSGASFVVGGGIASDMSSSLQSLPETTSEEDREHAQSMRRIRAEARRERREWLRQLKRSLATAHSSPARSSSAATSRDASPEGRLARARERRRRDEEQRALWEAQSRGLLHDLESYNSYRGRRRGAGSTSEAERDRLAAGETKAEGAAACSADDDDEEEDDDDDDELEGDEDLLFFRSDRRRRRFVESLALPRPLADAPRASSACRSSSASCAPLETDARIGTESRSKLSGGRDAAAASGQHQPTLTFETTTKTSSACATAKGGTRVVSSSSSSSSIVGIMGRDRLDRALRRHVHGD